jgi:hypothetical protein
MNILCLLSMWAAFEMSIVLYVHQCVHVAAFQKLIKSSAKCVHSFLISIKTRCTLHFQRRGGAAAARGVGLRDQCHSDKVPRYVLHVAAEYKNSMCIHSRERKVAIALL